MVNVVDSGNIESITKKIMIKEQIGICAALAKHFKIKPDVVKDIAKAYLAEVGGEHPVLDIELGGKSFKIGASKHSIKVSEMLFFKKFKKTALYGDALNLFENEEVDFVVFYSGSALMMLMPEEYYDGYGGVFLKDPSGYPAFTIQPVSHYLDYNYRVPDAE